MTTTHAAHTPLPPALAQRIIDFWFGSQADLKMNVKWFRKDEEFDNNIRSNFLPVVEAIGRGAGIPEFSAIPVSAETPADVPTHIGPPSPSDTMSSLAFILAVDQFPRNLFRGSSLSFAFDPLARTAARQIIDAGGDRSLHAVMRMFVYLPFEHSESLSDQEYSLTLFQSLGSEFHGLIDYAQRHHDIVRRFGRFPHRNAILGRPSTPEEEEFLQQPGSSF